MTMLTVASKASGSVVEELSRRWTGMRVEIGRLLDSRAAYRRAVDELSACSDRDLSDIGISRADIRRIAREAAQLAAHRDG